MYVSRQLYAKINQGEERLLLPSAPDALNLVLPDAVLCEGKSLHKKQLVSFEKSTRLQKEYKIGVLYERAYQRHGRHTTEDDLYNNSSSGPEFEEFLEWITTRVELKGWSKYRGGLDVVSTLPFFTLLISCTTR